MMALPENEDQVCFLVTKHTLWKGKYKRIFSFGTSGVTTYTPDNREVTNCWAYKDVASIRKTQDEWKFLLTLKKERKTDSMKFSTEHRVDLLTIAYQYSHLFTEKSYETQRYEAQKQHWSGILLPTMLEVTQTSLNQVDVSTHDVLAMYPFKDIDVIYDLADIVGGFIVTMKGTKRMHMFVATRKDDIKRKLEENAQLYLSIVLKIQNKPVTIDYFHNNRLGDLSTDEHTTSLVEFNVIKCQKLRHQDSPPRLFCLSQSCILERDPESYCIVTCRPLNTVMSIVRDESNPREFKVEYLDGSVRTYQGSNRDSILATIIDFVRGAGNKNVHVRMKDTPRAKRLGPYHSPLEEEVEACHLRLLRDSIGKKNMSDAIERFNCNVPYSGLLHSVTQDGYFKENKEKPIMEVLLAIVRCKEHLDFDSFCDEELEALYQCVRRLIASKVGFQAFTQVAGFRESLGSIVAKGLNKNSEALTHAAVDMLCALMHPMHEDYDLKQEQLNKSSLLGNHKFLNNLLDKWSFYALSGTGALVVCAVLDFLTFALCHPYSETTEGRNFDSLLEFVARRGRSLFKHFQHPCLTIVKGASLVMRALIEEGDSEIASQMQELALSECALIRHLLIALFTSKSDKPRLGQCQISRQLISLWLAGSENGNHLMQKILPSGLLGFLESSEAAPAEDDLAIDIRDNLKLAQDHAVKNQRNAQVVALEKQLKVLEKHLEGFLLHWGARVGLEKRQDKMKLAPVTLRKNRQRVKSNQNWKLFFYKFNQDHFLPNLIWNHKTRDELKTALDKEVKSFDANREISSSTVIAWNYGEFEVDYPCLKDQLNIDGYYIRIILDLGEAPESLTSNTVSFFNNVYHRFLLPTTSDMKCMCLRLLALVYEKYHEMIGYFADTKYIVSMLERTFDRSERDRLLMFLHALTFNKDNVKDIIVNSNGIEVLVDLLTLAHSHTSRATLPTQSNVIEFGSHTDREQEKEWHYCTSSDGSKSTDVKISLKELKKMYSNGIIKKDTKCWAQGMNNWKSVMSITQLKWSLVAQGTPLLNESDIAILILKMLINMINYYPCRNLDGAVIWPMSKIKQVLSSGCLHHIVQLLLTFEPVIVEKVATLLYNLCEENAFLPKLFTTGVFYFILMYNGSNVLPIARFLKLTHLKQAFRGDEAYGSDLMQRSILGQLLPEAMIFYLENHGPEKFAQIYLGEYDTPEAIWNSEMRCLLIQKIAAHIADFTPRLWSNNRSRYEYLVIPVVRYPQLQSELFCNIYYLRHLCDTVRFPNWPIADPVSVLRDVLELWASEVEKKPPTMSIHDAYRLLELPTEQNHHDEPTIRKAYYRLAQMYHPDKNSQGRVKFEAVNKAYDFLCSRSPWMDNGINTNNIVLILKTQSILFHRYSTELHPYKYAGYKQLIKTIQLETVDERLFSKQNSLLSAAIELIYHTILCSNLNAEEFNREGGFQVISDAFTRCVSVLSNSVKENDTLHAICLNCIRIFTITASFESCRTTFKQLSQLIPDLVRILHFKPLIKLTCAVVECVSAFSVDPDLQIKFLRVGVLWYLLTYLFLYDYTLEESGIESNEVNNQQGIRNELSKLSIKACAAIAGHSNADASSPHNEDARHVLATVLTPYLADRLPEDQPEPVLKILNSNCESPYLLWNNSTRAELLEFLNGCIKNRAEFDSKATKFTFSIHSSELIVGGIFIRIYNEQPNYKIKEPKKFVVDILDCIKSQCESLENQQPIELNHIVMVLTSLLNVILNNQYAALQCIGHFKLVFSLLAINSHEPIQVKTLSVISLLAKNEECVNDIASCGVIGNLLLVLYSLPTHQLITLDCFHSLVTSPVIVKQLIAKGSLPYFVDIVMNCATLEVRVKAAEFLGRLMEDKISGPKVKLLLLQLLPPAICDGFLESPQATVDLLQTNQENPEIIWNESNRQQLSLMISKHCQRLHLEQKRNPDTVFEMPDIKKATPPNEIVIGDVYLRLYNQNPAWSLRKPVKFLSDLLEAFLKYFNKPHDQSVEVIGKALVNVLSYNPGLANEIPSIGHLPRIFLSWKVSNHLMSLHTFNFLHLVFSNENCVQTLNRARVECLQPIKNAMSTNPDLITIACDGLSKLFEFKVDNLVKQALDCEFVHYFLRLLEDNLPQCENPARTKALIVKILKNMSGSLNGAAVGSVLEHSTIWPVYSEQNHDLFITSVPSTSYLTGPTTAGYLTQGPKPILNVPPPVEHDDRN